MAKGLRSNRKKAIRTLRRQDVKNSDKYVEEEIRRLDSLQETAEAGRRARELREQDNATQSMDLTNTHASSGAEKMDVDPAPVKRAATQGIPITQKKRFKLQKKKKADGINAFHKKGKKGKKKKK